MVVGSASVPRVQMNYKNRCRRCHILFLCFFPNFLLLLGVQMKKQTNEKKNEEKAGSV